MDVGWNRGSAGVGPSSFRTVVHLRPARSVFLPGCAVLSVAKLALGQEAYYEQQVALGLDDYYAGRGESPGLWAGAGAEGLDLSGVVADGDLGTLLRGVSPADGARLRALATERTITARTLDDVSGEWHDEAKTLTPVAGYDLVFSCPKSVSLLHALSDDESVRRAISDAHEASWQAALSYLESEACVVRRGRGGAIREHGQGFLAAAFRHRTSRAQDPHLHTHVIVANLARSSDGKWRALDGEAILRTYRLAAGYLYEANLRGALSRTLGVRWTEPLKGMAEIEGVPAEALRAFSTRRRSLVEHMEAMGTSGFAASRVAALATRERKERVDLPQLRESWLDRAGELGLGAHELRDLLDREPARELGSSCRRSPRTTSRRTRRLSPRPRSSASWRAPHATVRASRRYWPGSPGSPAEPRSRKSETTQHPDDRGASQRGACSTSSARLSRSAWEVVRPGLLAPASRT